MQIKSAKDLRKPRKIIWTKNQSKSRRSNKRVWRPYKNV